MDYIAHTRDDGMVQLLKDHIENVANMSRDFSVEDLKELCFAAGILHDAGKYTNDFQNRIRGDTQIHVEHSIIGSKILKEKNECSPELLLLEAVIAGHHSGIPDFGLITDTAYDNTLCGRLQRDASDYSSFFLENDFSRIKLDSKKFNDYLKTSCVTKDDIIEKFAFITRYIFSCLTDADSIDTIEFVTKKKRECLQADFVECLKRINERFLSFVPKTELQKARSRIQDQVYKKVNAYENFFLLNMPTGSGKTLCSTKFALQRAISKRKKRIIYVIPYNSIIDQTYSQLQSIFGDCAEILRHQSTFSYLDNDEINEEYRSRSLSSCENWDAQIIVTTAVQFFESVYDNKRKGLRKLHNYANSVIIFDEIHLMPINNMQPCLRAIEYIASLLNSDIVFCTATMPDFHKLFNQYTSLNIPLFELIEDKRDFHLFEKCTYKILGNLTDEELLLKSKQYPSSLIVVNTKHKAQELYSLANGKKYHLSTYMTSVDRLSVIETVKEELEKLTVDYPNLEDVPEERRITVISTSLIEAGVDLDFNCAFRELTGLDSILQTGGRCNREGMYDSGDVFVFTTEETFDKSAKDIRAEITKGIIKEYDNISSSNAISEYYNRLYKLNESKIISHSIVENMIKKDISRMPFASYSLKMIDSRQKSIFVPKDEISYKIYKKIKETKTANIRLVQPYSCSVSENEFKTLLELGVIDNYDTEVFCLENLDYYSETGINTKAKDYYV